MPLNTEYGPGWPVFSVPKMGISFQSNFLAAGFFNFSAV